MFAEHFEIIKSRQRFGEQFDVPWCVINADLIVLLDLSFLQSCDDFGICETAKVSNQN